MMKLIRKEVYPLPDFEYFRDKFDSWEEVINILQGFEDLSDILGLPNEYFEIKEN